MYRLDTRQSACICAHAWMKCHLKRRRWANSILIWASQSKHQKQIGVLVLCSAKSLSDFPGLRLFVKKKRFGHTECPPCLAPATELISCYLSTACSAVWSTCVLLVHVCTKMSKKGLIHHAFDAKWSQMPDSTCTEEDHSGQEAGIHPFRGLLFGETGSVSGDSTDTTYLYIFNDISVQSRWSRCSCLKIVSVFFSLHLFLAMQWMSLTSCTSVFLVTRVATILPGALHALRALQPGLESSCTRHQGLGFWLKWNRHKTIYLCNLKSWIRYNIRYKL